MRCDALRFAWFPISCFFFPPFPLFNDDSGQNKGQGGIEKENEGEEEEGRIILSSSLSLCLSRERAILQQQGPSLSDISSGPVAL